MGTALKIVGQFAACYVFWGLVTICDPHLVSEEAAEDHTVLQAVKFATDSVFTGMKLCFLAPICGVGYLKEMAKLNKE